MTFPLDKFLVKAEAIGHSNEYLEDISNYVSNLENKNLPVIFSFPHLCLLAGVNIGNIAKIYNSGRIDAYKRFKLKKKRGGYRVIQSPENELKYLQRWVLHNILEKIPSHSSCKGFDKRTSIKQNAEMHLNKQGILKIDLLRFYDSINEKRILGIFKSMGYHQNLAVSLAKICTLRPNQTFLNSFKSTEQTLKDRIKKSVEGILPQGAPTSPKLSNLIARRLDIRLAALGNKNNLSYSRYADDITFSGEIESLNNIRKIIYRIIREENFYVNYDKTKLLIRGNPFFVTGLSVNNNIVTVPKKRKKDIEHHLFHCIKNGVEIHLNKCGIKKRNFKDWLLGNIAFVYSVEKPLGEKYFNDFNKIEWPM